jgi:hypothetical protein
LPKVAYHGMAYSIFLKWWAPIKGTPTTPHLAAPHTALLSSPLAPELTPTARLHHRRFAAVTRPLPHRPISGEGTPGTSASPSLLRNSWQPPVSRSTCAPCSGRCAAALSALPPRSTMDRCRTWSTACGPSPRRFPYKNNSKIDNPR